MNSKIFLISALIIFVQVNCGIINDDNSGSQNNKNNSDETKISIEQGIHQNIQKLFDFISAFTTFLKGKVLNAVRNEEPIYISKDLAKQEQFRLLNSNRRNPQNNSTIDD